MTCPLSARGTRWFAENSGLSHGNAVDRRVRVQNPVPRFQILAYKFRVELEWEDW